MLIEIIENNDDDTIRLKSLLYLDKIIVANDDIFKFLESLLISDTNSKIRKISMLIIKEHFSDKTILPIMKWSIQFEKGYENLILIIKILEELNNRDSKKILVKELQKIKNRDFFDNDKQYSNKNFKNQLKSLKKYSIHQLAEILINYKTISEIIQKFYTVFFEWNNALITKLDLSEIGWNVNIWRQQYSDKISSLSEIIGLRNLKNLKILDLSNNRLRNIKDLINLENITHLYLTNNKLQGSSNIEYLKRMKNLKYLDISANPLAEVINKENFPELNLILNKGQPNFLSNSIM
jgi:Leucine-rich repeat (LRR) protein